MSTKDMDGRIRNSAGRVAAAAILTARGWPYGRAHKDSSRIEFRCRRNPGRLDAALRAEVKNNASSGSPVRH